MIKRLEAINFCSFSELAIDFEQQGLVFVGGDNKDTSSALNNGAGKSALFKALLWTLYGESIDGDRGNSVIRFGEAETRCKVFLEGNIEIERGRKKDLPFLSLFEDGVDFVGDKKEIQNRIDFILGVNFDGFRNTVFFGQNDIKRFASNRTKDGDRKRVLNHILGTEILPVCHRVVKNMMGKTIENLSELEAQKREIKARLEEQDLEQLKEDFSNFEQIKNEELERVSILRAERINAIRQKEREKKILGTGANIKKQSDLRKMEMKINESNVKEINENIDEFSIGIEIIEEKQNELREKVEEEEQSKRIIEEKLSNLSGDRCFICNTKLNSKVIQKYKKELVSSLEEKNERLKNFDGEGDFYHDEFMSFASQREELVKKLDDIWELKGRAKELKNEMKEDREKAEIKKSYIEREIVSLKKQLKEHRIDFEEINNRENPFEEKIKKVKKYISILNKKLKENNQKYKKEKTREKFLKFWVRGFSNRGILSFLLDSVVPFVESKSNEYLKILSDGDIILDISTQRKLVTKDYRDEIKIDWTIEGIKGHSPSGGQLKKIEIAVGFALMQLVDSINGAKLNLLILDEVLDGLDLEGTQRVLMLLKELKREKESIFVISHQSQISEVFDKKIMVEKRKGVSSLL